MASPATTSDDVPDDAFYRGAVDWMADQAITTGTSATTYSPDRAIRSGMSPDWDMASA